MRTLIIAALAATAAALDMETKVMDQTLIKSINAGEYGWRAAPNAKFADAKVKDVVKLMGAIRNTPEWHRKRAVRPHTDLAPLSLGALPVNFTAMDSWPQCTPIFRRVRDQSDCGCCWAFGSTESFNDRWCIAKNDTATVLSVQQTCSCVGGSSQGCDGGFLEDAWTSFTSKGAVTGGDYPDIGKGTSCFPFQLATCDHHEGTSPYPSCTTLCPNGPGGECATPKCRTSCSESTYPVSWSADAHKASKWYGVSGVANIMTEIYTRGPVGMTMDVYSDFLTYESGVYTKTAGASLLGGHAMKILGWGTTAGGVDYWVIQNSWNSYWGNQGLVYVKRGVDECGCEDDIVAGTI